MNKAMLLSTGIKLNVIGKCGYRATPNGLIKEYRVKKDTANAVSTFRITKDKILFIH